MAFLPSLSPDEIQHYHRVVTHSVNVRSHFDVLVWLQGDMQRYLPHDIMIAAWGDFTAGAVQHDIISAMTGVRSSDSNPETLTPMLLRLFARWKEFGKKPFSLNTGESGFLLEDTGLKCALGDALQQMRSAMVHGIHDERGSHDCLYVTFSTRERVFEHERSAMAMVLPHIDSALRQVEHLPHQTHVQTSPADPPDSRFVQEHDLSDRELEILQWVALGKTNPEIGSILDISTFTVKNHLQRVFKKLDVSNRAQAVGKFNLLMGANV
jgi:transcriptional regulator EpsA